MALRLGQLPTPAPVCYDPCVLSVGRASAEALPRLAASAQAFDFDIYQRLRHENLARSPGGRYFIELYDTHTREMTQIVRANPQVFDDRTTRR